jgi:hypothetical protein
LILASPLVDEAGLLSAYQRIRKAIEKAEPSNIIDLQRISVFSPKSAFMKSLRKKLRNIRDFELTGYPVGDHFVEKGYLYFVK